MRTSTRSVVIRRWTNSQAPSASAITRMMETEGMRPFKWENPPNRTFTIRSHGYDKVVWVVEGALELILPDENLRYVLRAGDRAGVHVCLEVEVLDERVPAGHHGGRGAQCAAGR